MLANGTGSEESVPMAATRLLSVLMTMSEMESDSTVSCSHQNDGTTRVSPGRSVTRIARTLRPYLFSRQHAFLATITRVVQLKIQL